MIAEYPFVEAPYPLVPLQDLRPSSAPVAGEAGTLADFFDARPNTARRTGRPMPRMYSVAQQRVRSRIEKARKCNNQDMKVERLFDALDQAGVVRLTQVEIEKLSVEAEEESGIAQAKRERFPTPPPPDRNTPGVTEATNKRMGAEAGDYDDYGDFGAFADPADPEANVAAKKVQSVYRGKRSRTRVKKIRNEKQKMMRAEEDAAATKVQSIYRGQMARRKLAEHGPEEEQMMKSSDTFMKAEVDEDPELHNAATKVQSAFRGKQARNRVAGIHEEKAVKKEMDMAATKVQSVYRGRAARKKVAMAYAEGYGEMMEGALEDAGEGYENEDGYDAGYGEGYEEEGYQGEGYEEEGYYEGEEGEGYYEGQEGEEYYGEAEPGEDGYYEPGETEYVGGDEGEGGEDS